MSTYHLKNLLSPHSIALVGGSPRHGSVGRAILNNIRKAQFKGEFGLVNPRYHEIDGVATAGSIAELAFAPELVVLTTPARTIAGLIDEAGRRGAAGAVIVSAGLGHGPGSLADAAERAAQKYGMRLVGPNCLGIMMPGVSLNASFSAHMPAAGNLALISQSGAIAAGMVDWAAQRAVGFSGIVSIGDQLDVDIADLLDYFALDEKTHAILLYIEAIKDARKFMSAARAAARVKPVVVVKSGRMAQGARAAATHTGALAGADAVYDAAFQRAGLLRVSDLRELFDCAETLGRLKSPPGKRLTILTNGGGIGVLAVDRLVELGGIPADISAATRDKLDAVLPPTWSKSNPVDIVGDSDPARYAAALELLLADASNDAVLVMNVQTAIARADDIAAAVIGVVGKYRAERRMSPKPVLAVWVGADPSISDLLSGAGIPNYQTGGDAVLGFMHLVRHREAVEALARVPPAMPSEFVPDTDAARQIVAAALADGRSWLDPIEVKRLLDAYDIAAVPTFAAADAEEAVAHANALFAQGSTVVLKIMSRDIVHKSDVGGVVLNLTSADAVRKATTEILARAKIVAAGGADFGRDGAGDGAAGEGARADSRPRRRSDLWHRRRVRPWRHGGRDHQRQGAGAAAARPATGARPDRAHPRLAAAARLSRRAGGEAGRRRDGSGQAGTDGSRHSRNPRTRHQPAAGGRSRRARRRRPRRGRARGAEVSRFGPGQFRRAALSVAMAASHRGQGRLAHLRSSAPARGRAADPRDCCNTSRCRICGCASSRR